MYMNNRAAEALARERLDDAYWWAREAVVQNPAFNSSYITLGVVYLRHGELQQADRVFAQVLERQPANTQALANRASLLEKMGRVDEANALKVKLASIEPYPPFHFFDLGREAMQRGDFKTARDLFAREVAPRRLQRRVPVLARRRQLPPRRRRSGAQAPDARDGAQRERQGPRSVCGEAGVVAVVSQAVERGTIGEGGGQLADARIKKNNPACHPKACRA